MPQLNRIVAVIQSIQHGRHGPFAVTTVDPDLSKGSTFPIGSVTFSLEAKVWKGKKSPEPGDTVVLRRLKKRRAGWRAEYGRPYTLSDEKGVKKQQ